MKSSEVLALKYRPRRFEEIIGQESISQTLSLALDSKRLSHAYLFSGLRGSGKTSTARIFAKALMCERGPTSHPCEVCPQCQMASEGRHSDIIEMDAASSRKIDDIRDLIEHTKYLPAQGRYKVFIIDEVHMLTKEAHNALLKTLEEPPSYVKFILATTDPLKLPPTILSRTQHFRFKQIAPQDILHHLIHILNTEGIEYQEEALAILARSGSGSLRDTLTMLDQAIIYTKGYVDVETVTQMLGILTPSAIETLFEAILTKDRPRLIGLIREFELYDIDMVIDELILWLKERLYEGDHRFNTLVMERFFHILSDAKGLLSINAEGGFVLALAVFKMIEALKVKEIDTLITQLEEALPTPHAPPPQRLVQEPVVETISPFDRVRAKIQDRSAELYGCFERNVRFVSYQDGVLSWQSCAQGKDKELLRHSYGIIRHFVYEIYGVGTTITPIPCTEPTPEPMVRIAQEPSMIESIEMGSCVGGCEEVDAQRIEDHPTVRRAMELLEPTKITISSKV